MGKQWVNSVRIPLPTYVGCPIVRCVRAQRAPGKPKGYTMRIPNTTNLPKSSWAALGATLASFTPAYGSKHRDSNTAPVHYARTLRRNGWYVVGYNAVAIPGLPAAYVVVAYKGSTAQIVAAAASATWAGAYAQTAAWANGVLAPSVLRSVAVAPRTGPKVAAPAATNHQPAIAAQ